MRAMMSLVILAVSATVSGATLTAHELMLLRVILRQDMAADVQAAAGSTDAAAASRVAPLQTALLGDPDVHGLRAIMTNEKTDILQRLNAARALAYFGDTQSIDFLADVLHTKSRILSTGPARGQAGLCLLYLGYDFPPDFAFRDLPSPAYPELDVFLRKPTTSLAPTSFYTREELQAALAAYLAGDYPLLVRGPLSVLEVEQESLVAILSAGAHDGSPDVLRIPFGDRYYEWEQFKALVGTHDLIYGFTSDDAAGPAQEGSEGYALIRDGRVVAAILTSRNQASGTDIVAFDDFDDTRLGFNWNILHSDPSHWSLSKVPDTLTITTQAGSFTLARQDYKNIFLIPCPVAPGQDFQVTTCLVGFQPIGIWNQAGLLIWNSEDYHVKLVYEYGEGPPVGWLQNQHMFTSVIEDGGVASHAWYQAPQNPPRVWLRIVKRPGVCELFTSTDGQYFTPVSALVPEWGPWDNRVYWGDADVKYVGIFADNGTADMAPSVDASFDFFEVQALPAGD
jgi:regulation of enolase protein 1 (concanavalin A-like superfamily)